MSTPWLVAFVFLSSTVLVLGITVVGLVRRFGDVFEAVGRIEQREGAAFRPTGLAEGTAVPPFAIESSDGSRFRRQDLIGSPSIVLFVESTCAPCRELIGVLDSGAAGRSGSRSDLAELLWIVADDSAESRTLLASVRARCVFEHDRSVSHVFENNATPQAFALDAAGRVVARTTANSTRDLQRLAAKLREGGGPDAHSTATAVTTR